MPHSLTQILLDHRASGELIGEIPADAVPHTAAAAYQVQNETIAQLGAVGAWKVQPLPATGEPFAAPILASSIVADGATIKTADYPSLGIEVEVALTLSRDLPALPGGYIGADVEDAIGSVHVALELLASRFVDRSKVPQLTGIADLQHSGGIVLGAPVAVPPLPEFGRQAMVLTVDGSTVASTEGNATTDNVLGALAWLANHAAGRNLPLKAGTIVITGARLGPVALTGSAVEARAEGLGTVSVRFT